MRMKKTILIPDPTYYFTQKDEDTFFNWLYTTPGFVTVVGRPEGLYLTLKSITYHSVMDIMAAMSRYGLDVGCLAASLSKTEIRKICESNKTAPKERYKYLVGKIFGKSTKKKKKASKKSTKKRVRRKKIAT